MSTVTTLQQLLITCLQDLRKGEDLTLDRFPAIARVVTDNTTQTVLWRRLSEAQTRAEHLDSLGSSLDV